MKIKIRKLDLMEFLFVILILASEHFFYLFELPISNSDIALVIAVLMFCLYLLFYRASELNKFPKTTKWLFIILAASIVISSIRGNISYGQSIMKGLRPQRFYLIFLAYFPIKNIILRRKNGLKFIMNTMVAIGTIAVCIFVLQYLLFTETPFLTVNYDYRFGEVRLRFTEVLSLFGLFYAYHKILKKFIFRWLVVFIIHFFYYVMVIKGRFGIFVLLIALVALALFFNKDKLKGVLIVALAGIVLLYAPLPIVDEYIEEVREGLDSYENETDVRYKGQVFYMRSLTEDTTSLILGKGYVNLQDDSATRISKAEEYYIDDNGYFGIAYYYGIVGVLWNVFLFFYIIYVAFKRQKKGILSVDCGVGIGITFLIGSILCPYTMYFYTIVVLAVILAVLDYDNGVSK